MIIWLASYPRSGNTLLRTILRRTMQLESYSDEQVPSNIGFTEVALKEFGHLSLPYPWESFYEMAQASKRTHLIKTHLLPRDDQPVIYVVRDGRQSLVSYQHYHRRHFPDHPGGLLELVLGLDYYGGWSQHFTGWTSGKRNVLLVRYEDLVNASPATIHTLAKFVRHEGTVLKWSNSFDQLHVENPNFFRIGKTEWHGAPGWSDFVNSVFFFLHGNLMGELGYEKQRVINDACASLSNEVVQMINLVRSVQGQKKVLENACHERLLLINRLNAKVNSAGASRPVFQSLLTRLTTWVR